ncbi:MAG: hypothetical protein AB1585_10150 [Thermodesulfobacteriota bacterium]
MGKRVNKKILFFLMILLTVFGFMQANFVYADSVSQAESEKILERLFVKYPPIYEKYRGVESTSRVVSKEYDPKTHVLKNTTEVLLHRKDFFYDKPEIKALSFKINGKEADPAKYRSWETKPAYLAFDKKGRENYLFKVTEKKKIDQRDCYRVEVNPRKATSRHFQGEIYCALDTLDVVRTMGGVADLEFPLKSFWSEFNYTLVKEVPVVQSGTLKIRVNVPIIFPDTMMVTSTTILESKLME